MTIATLLRAALMASAMTVPVAADASAADFRGLQAWVGKYPSDRIGGRTFFDHPGLRAEMRKTMGNQAYSALQRMQGPEDRVVRVGEHIGVWHCQAHDCGDKNSTVIARLASGDAVVCWQQSPDRAGQRWYIPGRPPVDERGEGGCPADAAAIAAAIRRLGF